MLNILAVRFMNVFTFGNETHSIDFTSTASTLIVGGNGAGKSSGTLDTLCFALYGRGYRDITKNQIINTWTEKGALVEVDFARNGHNYTVKRGIKPNIFEIWKDGALVDPVDAREYQRHLEEDILGIDLKTFKGIIVIGKADHLPFLKLDAKQRREMVEDVLDLKVFSDMRQIVKTKGDVNAQALNEIDKRLIAVKAELDAEKRHADAAKADNAGRIEVINFSREQAKERITDFKNIIEEDRKQIEELRTGLGNIQALTDSITELDNMRYQIVSKKVEAEKKIEFYTTKHNCPTCDHIISSEEAAAYIAAARAKIDELNNGRVKLTMMIDQKKEKRNGYLEIAKSIEIIERNISSIETEIKMEAREQLKLNDELKTLNMVTEADEGRLNDLGASYTAISTEKDANLAEGKVIAQAALLLKDNGVKARVIAKYIPLFNDLINKYLEIMGLFVGFELDENFKETIKSRGRDKFTYESFSEGEKFRIDLAILFAWREIAKMRNSTSANILIFDEVLDGSLDHDGKSALLKLLREAENVHIFVISHDQEQYIDNFDRVLRFVKKSNFSRIETA